MKAGIITHEPRNRARDLPPLLFVHGAFVGGWCWAENFLPYFAELGYRAHAIDLCRNGRGIAASASLSDYLDAIGVAIAGLGESPVLIGHSMGGFLVQRYLSRQSARAAVLMASVPPQGVLPSTAWLAFGNPLLFQQLQVMQWFGPAAAFAIYGVDGARRPLFSPHLADDKVMKYAARARMESPQAIFELTLPLHHPPRRAPGVETLVMGAALDSLIPSSAIHATARQHETQAVFVDELGHAMMLDHHWQEAAAVIRDWLIAQGL
jgi:pimeloyl-ACP methyl ester carboxylesterase